MTMDSTDKRTDRDRDLSEENILTVWSQPWEVTIPGSLTSRKAVQFHGAKGNNQGHAISYVSAFFY